MKSSSIILLTFSLFIFNSCLISDSVRTFEIEILKPGIINFEKNIDSIAIINRTLYNTENNNFKYSEGINLMVNSKIKYSELSSQSIESLANNLNKSSYFKDVKIFNDSLYRNLEMLNAFKDPSELFKVTNSDLWIFLDIFNIQNSHINYIDDFFRLTAELRWIFVIKNDSNSYVYNQKDTLTFTDIDFDKSKISKNKYLHPSFFAADYLGKFCAGKIVPSWLKVERMYYHSKNVKMLEAEKFSKRNMWINAAEIWNRESKNKNKKIALKASYNMALACEMQGKNDLAIEWLVKSFEISENKYPEHYINCTKYVAILTLRNRENSILEKQFRNNKEIP